MTIQTVGIIGAGTMGHGIAEVCAAAGLKTILLDVEQAAVERGLKAVSGNLDRLLKKEKIGGDDKAAILSRIAGTTGQTELVSADLVIEAASENLVEGGVAEVGALPRDFRSLTADLGNLISPVDGTPKPALKRSESPYQRRFPEAGAGRPPGHGWPWVAMAMTLPGSCRASSKIAWAAFRPATTFVCTSSLPSSSRPARQAR
jgi:NAD(P)-dependent dehydrogenase (short-subunit alcohol dehydrogenase family)